ncbi:MAG: tetratricopeptide repeat protein, partial [Planctomycetota bacterium]
YMSPEQALAQRVPVDHRTDIYSLSITLYELLTLKQAFPGDDPRAAMQEIALKEPTKPRALNPATPPALKTVLLKAMSKDPADRYATAKELADDLRRFLEDRPIHARRPSLLKRGTQWARRHRPVMWAAAAVLLLTVVALSIGTFLLSREAERTRAQWQRAERHAQAARHNLAALGELVDGMLTRVSQQLADRPGLEQFRKELLQRALEFHLDFLKQKGDDPALQAGAGAAYARLGDIYALLGNREQSLRAHEQSVGVFEALVKDSDKYRSDLALSVRRLAGALFAIHRFEEAHSQARRLLVLTQELRASAPAEDVDWLVGHGQHILGQILERRAQPDEARLAYERSLDAWEAVVASNPTPGNRFLVTLVLGQLVDWHLAQGRVTEVEDQLDRYLDMTKELVSEGPDPALRKNLGLGWKLRANLLIEKNRLEEAEKAYQEALSVYDDLQRDFPKVPDYSHRVGIVLHELGMGVYLGMKRPQDFWRTANRVHEIYRDLAGKHPEDPVYRFYLARSHQALATALTVGMGPVPRAAQEFVNAIEILDTLESDLASDREYRGVRMDVYSGLGSVLVDSGQFQRAKEPLRRCIALGERLVEDYGAVARDKRALAGGYTSLGIAQYQTGHAAAGEKSLRRALKLHSSDHNALNTLAWYLAMSTDPALRRQAVQLAQRAVKLAPKEAGYCNTLGVARYRTGDWRGAVQALKQSLALESWGKPVTDWIFLAMAHWQLNDRKEAREFFDRADAWIEQHPGDPDLERFRAEAAALLGESD